MSGPIRTRLKQLIRIVDAFGSLWIVQFVVLDQLLFASGRRARTTDPSPA